MSLLVVYVLRFSPSTLVLYNGHMKLRVAFVLVVSLSVGLLGAGVSLLLPNQYTAKGLLVVTRKTDPPASEFFTYEGSYAQQNSGTYTGTFMAILQSPANLASADTGLEVEELERLIRVKKEGSQGISLSVKANSSKEASRLWTKLADSAIATHNSLANSGDPLLTVIKTPGSPVVMDTYPEWRKIFGASFGFSAVIMSTLIMLIRYLKEDGDY